MDSKDLHLLITQRLYTRERTKAKIAKLWSLILLMEARKPGSAKQVLERSEERGFNYWYQSLHRQHQDNMKTTKEDVKTFAQVFKQMIE